jgi:hypothetical protein
VNDHHPPAHQVGQPAPGSLGTPWTRGTSMDEHVTPAVWGDALEWVLSESEGGTPEGGSSSSPLVGPLVPCADELHVLDTGPLTRPPGAGHQAPLPASMPSQEAWAPYGGVGWGSGPLQGWGDPARDMSRGLQSGHGVTCFPTAGWQWLGRRCAHPAQWAAPTTPRARGRPQRPRAPFRLLFPCGGPARRPGRGCVPGLGQRDPAHQRWWQSGANPLCVGGPGKKHGRFGMPAPPPDPRPSPGPGPGLAHRPHPGCLI